MPQRLYNCPISGHILDPPPSEQPGDIPYFSIVCESCGRFEVDLITLNVIEAELKDPQIKRLGRDIERRRAVLSFALPRMASSERVLRLTSDFIDRILKEDRLPTLTEQQDNLLRWLDGEGDPGSAHGLTYRQLSAVVGAESEGAFNLLIEGMISHRLLAGQIGQVRLTYDGLKRIEELRRSEPSGFNAFMAMKFGDPILDELVDQHFKPAVNQTGFSLYRLNDRPQAGLIDARLRNEIRQSRFIVVDESHANLGAYWEAGYAEGLGKPVIYTCERSVFDGKSPIQRPHFDTNHHMTIVWENDKFAEAADELKQFVRLSVPEAKQVD